MKTKTRFSKKKMSKNHRKTRYLEISSLNSAKRAGLVIGFTQRKIVPVVSEL